MGHDPSNLDRNHLRKWNRALIGGLLVVGMVMIAMLAMTWRTWPEPVIDFGRELYVPWQLAQGKVLYRDIAYFNGPLSPYFNSIIFRVTGARLMSLVVVNIGILAGVTLMFYLLAVKLAGHLSATVACCAFLLLLAIGQPGPVGNYNFLTPYSHEMTHGLALSLAAICAMQRLVATSKHRWSAAAGALVGMVFLTKPEFFAAVFIATVVGLLSATRKIERGWKEVAFFAASGIAVVTLAILLLALAMPLYDATGAVLGAWRWVFDSRLNDLPFYQRVRGTFDISETLRALSMTTLGYAVLLGLPLLSGRFWRVRKWSSAMPFAVSFCVIGVGMFFARDRIPWEEIGRPMIVVALICTAFAAARVDDENGIVRLTFSIFALLLLGKIALHVRFYHYGFALAAPALVLTIISAIGWLPAWIDRTGGSGNILRGASLAAVVVACGMYVQFDHRTVETKRVLVGEGDDAFYASAGGGVINGIVQVLETQPPETSIAVIPEGAMVNYLSRRPNSTPYIVLMPPEVLMFGQGRIVDAFRGHPPDLILRLKSDAGEYGSAGFNVDYGKNIADWIDANYRVIAGNPSDPNMKWQILKKNVGVK